jgi:hypothetical protein
MSGSKFTLDRLGVRANVLATSFLHTKWFTPAGKSKGDRRRDASTPRRRGFMGLGTMGVWQGVAWTS